MLEAAPFSPADGLAANPPGDSAAVILKSINFNNYQTNNIQQVKSKSSAVKNKNLAKKIIQNHSWKKKKNRRERGAVPGTGGGKPVDGPLAGAATGNPATIQQLIYMLLVNYFYLKKKREIQQSKLYY